MLSRLVNVFGSPKDAPEVACLVAWTLLQGCTGSSASGPSQSSAAAGVAPLPEHHILTVVYADCIVLVCSCRMQREGFCRKHQ